MKGLASPQGKVIEEPTATPGLVHLLLPAHPEHDLGPPLIKQVLKQQRQESLDRVSRDDGPSRVLEVQLFKDECRVIGRAPV